MFLYSLAYRYYYAIFAYHNNRHRFFVLDTDKCISIANDILCQRKKSTLKNALFLSVAYFRTQ